MVRVFCRQYSWIYSMTNLGKIRSLYKNFNQNLIEEYSAFKYGDRNIINKYADELVGLIKQDHISLKSVVYTTNKYPIYDWCKKNSLILAEVVAKKLSLPLVVGQYQYKYSSKKFYDNANVRKAVIPEFFHDEKTRYRHYNFIFIDDSIVGGQSMIVSRNLLESISKNVKYYFVCDFRKCGISERIFNEAAYNKYGNSWLIKLINTPKYVFTTQMIRTLETLCPEDRNCVFIRIKNPETKKYLLKSFLDYTGSSFI